MYKYPKQTIRTKNLSESQRCVCVWMNTQEKATIGTRRREGSQMLVNLGLLFWWGGKPHDKSMPYFSFPSADLKLATNSSVCRSTKTISSRFWSTLRLAETSQVVVEEELGWFKSSDSTLNTQTNKAFQMLLKYYQKNIQKISKGKSIIMQNGPFHNVKIPLLVIWYIFYYYDTLWAYFCCCSKADLNHTIFCIVG